uniref:Uncharacterized protein n=1 Tax=Pseudomonas aeruginosa TaxID=287 RepID=A0A5E5QSG3_PSEAI|nr:hypothetical protein TUEID40_00182 [Pseudomonas aeruginosa]
MLEQQRLVSLVRARLAGRLQAAAQQRHQAGRIDDERRRRQQQPLERLSAASSSRPSASTGWPSRPGAKRRDARFRARSVRPSRHLPAGARPADRPRAHPVPAPAGSCPASSGRPRAVAPRRPAPGAAAPASPRDRPGRAGARRQPYFPAARHGGARRGSARETAGILRALRSRPVAQRIAGLLTHSWLSLARVQGWWTCRSVIATSTLRSPVYGSRPWTLMKLSSIRTSPRSQANARVSSR